MADALTQKEIDSLLRGSTPLASLGSTPEIQAYDFLRPPRISRERRATLEAIYSRFALNCQAFLSSRLRGPTDLEAASVEQATFAEFILSLGNPCACFAFELHDATASAGVIDLSADFAYQLVDRLFGGPGEVRDIRRPLTLLERTVVQQIVERMLGLLREAWQDHLAIAPAVTGFESSPEMLQPIAREASVLVTNIHVRSGGFSGVMTMAIPLLALETFLQDKSAVGRVLGRRAAHASDEIRQQLETRLRHAAMDIRVRLPAIRLTTRAVARLEQGQILRLHHPVDAPLDVYVNGRRRFQGTLGQLRRQIGVRITTVLPAEPADPVRAPLRGSPVTHPDAPVPPALGDLTPAAPRPGASAALESLLDISLPVVVEFGRTTMTVQDVLELGPGSVIQLPRVVGEPVDLYVSDRRLAEGEVVVVGEHFGVRITRILAEPDTGATQ